MKKLTEQIMKSNPDTTGHSTRPAKRSPASKAGRRSARAAQAHTLEREREPSRAKEPTPELAGLTVRGRSAATEPEQKQERMLTRARGTASEQRQARAAGRSRGGSSSVLERTLAADQSDATELVYAAILERERERAIKARISSTAVLDCELTAPTLNRDVQRPSTAFTIDIKRRRKSPRMGKVNLEPAPLFDADQIRDIRLRLRMSQISFADLLGISVKAVEAWEAGRNKPGGPALRLMALYIDNPNMIPYR